MPLFPAGRQKREGEEEPRKRLPLGQYASASPSVSIDYIPKRPTAPEEAAEQAWMDDTARYAAFERSLDPGTSKSEAQTAVEGPTLSFVVDRKGDRDIFIYDSFDNIPDYSPLRLQQKRDWKSHLMAPPLSCQEFVSQTPKEPLKLDSGFKYNDSLNYVKLVGEGLELAINENEEFLQRVSNIQTRVRKDEQNVGLWLEFIRTEDSLERKLSISEEALRTVSSKSASLWIEHLKILEKANPDTKTILQKWQQALSLFGSDRESELHEIWTQYLEFRCSHAFLASDWMAEAEKCISSFTSSKIKVEMLLKITTVLFEAGYAERALLILKTQIEFMFKGRHHVRSSFNNYTDMGIEVEEPPQLGQASPFKKWLVAERTAESAVFCYREDDPHSTVLFADIDPFLFNVGAGERLNASVCLLDHCLYLLLRVHLLGTKFDYDSVFSRLCPSSLFGVREPLGSAYGHVAKSILASLLGFFEDLFEECPEMFSLVALCRILVDERPEATAKSILKRRESPLIWAGYCIIMLPDSICQQIFLQLKGSEASDRALLCLIKIRLAEEAFLRGEDPMPILCDGQTSANGILCAKRTFSSIEDPVIKGKGLLFLSFLLKGFDEMVREFITFPRPQEELFSFYLSLGFYHFYSKVSDLRPFKALLADALFRFPESRELCYIELKCVELSMILPKNLKSRLQSKPSISLLKHLANLCVRVKHDLNKARSLFAAADQFLGNTAEYYVEYLDFLGQHFPESNHSTVVYQSLKRCPWTKELYLRGVCLLLQRKSPNEGDLTELVNAMEEKEMRVRVLLEEFTEGVINE